jgi:hypothetical protein
MIRTFQVSFVILAAVLLAACSHLQVARQRIEYRGFLEDWGVNSSKKPWIYVPLLFAVLLLASCSSVAVTRLPNGTLHAGPTSFAGKQFIGKATIRTREGDEIVLENYGTQNPDPETTKIITNGMLINTGIKVGGEVLDTGIKEGSKLINTAIE